MGRFERGWDRVRQWAPVQLLLATLFLFVALIARELVLVATRAAIDTSDLPTVWLAPAGSSDIGWRGALYGTWAAVLTIALGVLAYRGYVRLVERRALDELSREGAARESSAGVGLGTGFIGAVVLILVALGACSVGLGPGGWIVVAAGARALTAAFMEELAMRGVVFRIVEARLGSWLALGLSAVLFGGLHAGNPAATLWSTAALALSAGVVLGAAFMATRRLWLAIGMHFGANLAQGPLLGLPVSGQSEQGLLASQLDGPAFLSGGSFGIEASFLTPLLALGIAVALLRYAATRGRLLPPAWATR